MAKLLSALPRIIMPFSNTGTPYLAPAGLGTIDALLINPFPIPMFHKVKLDASLVISVDSAHQSDVSLESANMQLQLVSTGLALISQAARLSSLTALAQGQVVSIDPFDVDGYELAVAGGIGANPNLLQLAISLTFNNSSGTYATLTWSGSATKLETIWNSYEFPSPNPQ